MKKYKITYLDHQLNKKTQTVKGWTMEGAGMFFMNNFSYSQFIDIEEA